MAEKALLDTMGTCGLVGDSWAAWRAVAKALSASPMAPSERRLYESCTGRTTLPREPVTEALLLCGRRSGKSRFAGAVGVHAASREYPSLAPGELATVGIAASDRQQARTVLNYVTAPFRKDAALRPLVQQRSRWEALAALVTRQHRWGVDLRSGVTVEVSTASFRAVRGRTFAAAICDELAFWTDSETGANPAPLVLDSIRPALATLRGPLVMITSPFAKSGVVYDLFTRYWGVDDAPVLVWRAASRLMNPALDPRVVEQAMARDEQAARAEYGAEFRDDLASFVSVEALRRVVVAGRAELPPQVEDCDHCAFVDAAGGSGADSMTLGVAHGEQVEGTDRVVAVLDFLAERRPPFAPSAVAAEFAAVIKRYGCHEVVGDNFSPGWVAEAFARHGLSYRVSKKTRSAIYADFLPALNDQRVELLDHARLLQQLQALQRSAAAGGRESIDHPSRGHDDLANAACGALVIVLDAASTGQAPVIGWLG